MRILHILPNSNKSVIEAFIKFVSENFDEKHHKFCIITNNNPSKVEITKFPNIVILSTLSAKNIIAMAKSTDKVILHSLGLKTTHMFELLFHPEVFNKLIWVAWGADLYQWNNKIEGNIFRKPKIQIKNSIALYFRKRIKYFVGIFPPDIDCFKSEFKSKASTFYASYVTNLYNPLYESNLSHKKIEDKIKSNESIKIQIGHSSSRVLNHLEVLNKIEKYKNENIKIFIPLSYGDMTYGDYVQKKAYEIFGDKAICIREMMSKDDYMDYLSTIDIAIFNTTRQIGLGNISPMLYMEKKLYMPKGSVMYDFYKSQQIDVWDYNNIADFDYNEFIQPLRFKGGRKYIFENELDLEHKIDMWRKVFEAPLK